MKREIFFVATSYVDMGNIIKALLAVLFLSVYWRRVGEWKEMKINDAFGMSLRRLSVISRCSEWESSLSLLSANILLDSLFHSDLPIKDSIQEKVFASRKFSCHVTNANLLPSAFFNFVFLGLFAGVTCVFLLLNISLAVFLKFCGKSRFRGAVWEISPLLAWIFAITQLFLQLFLKGTVTPR